MGKFQSDSVKKGKGGNVCFVIGFANMSEWRGDKGTKVTKWKDEKVTNLEADMVKKVIKEQRDKVTKL